MKSDSFKWKNWILDRVRHEDGCRTLFKSRLFWSWAGIIGGCAAECSEKDEVDSRLAPGCKRGLLLGDENDVTPTPIAEGAAAAIKPPLHPPTLEVEEVDISTSSSSKAEASISVVTDLGCFLSRALRCEENSILPHSLIHSNGCWNCNFSSSGREDAGYSVMAHFDAARSAPTQQSLPCHRRFIDI